MRTNSSKRKTWKAARASLLAALLLAAAGAVARSRTREGASVTVTNGSSRTIVHLYTSPPDRNDWSADYLPDGSNFGNGASYTLNGFVCSGEKIKVIAEDKDGCFMYAAASCQSSSSWTITDATPRDCGN